MKSGVVRVVTLQRLKKFSRKRFNCRVLRKSSRVQGFIDPDQPDQPDQQAEKAAFLRHLLVRVALLGP
jgi:hypothetical protein